MSRPHSNSEPPGDDVSGHAFRLRGVSAAAPTLVRLTSSQAGLPEGDLLALAAQVVTVGPGPAATGDVTFLVNGRSVGTAALDATGQAALDGLRLPVGVHAVVASYGGDAEHAAATSAALPQAVTAAPAPVVVLVAGPEPTTSGFVIEAELVDPRTGRLAEDASGDLQFSVGGAVLGAVPLRAGLARLQVDRVPSGPLRVAFGGDREHAPAEGGLPGDPTADPVATAP